jgi:hypothetical protein
MLIQIGEAVLAGIGVGYAAYLMNNDLHAALVAGFGAALAKFLPAQVVPKA